MTETSYIFNPPQYPSSFFEEDSLYWIAGHLYHVLAVADTKFGRLAWALMDVNGAVDVQTLTPSLWKQASRV